MREKINLKQAQEKQKNLNKMDNFDLKKYLAEGRLFENTINQISSRIVKLGKEAGISSDDIEEYVDGLESSFEPDAYKNKNNENTI